MHKVRTSASHRDVDAGGTGQTQAVSVTKHVTKEVEGSPGKRSDALVTREERAEVDVTGQGGHVHAQHHHHQQHQHQHHKHRKHEHHSGEEKGDERALVRHTQEQDDDPNDCVLAASELCGFAMILCCLA